MKLIPPQTIIFTKSAPALFAFDAPGTKERFVDFGLMRKWIVFITLFNQVLPAYLQIPIDTIAAQAV